MSKLNQLGFGGGCHWCTEAVFQSLKGVLKVEQGWIASIGENSGFSEAVIVHYDHNLIPTKTLIEVHLLTHASESSHSMRGKYRSAIYFPSLHQKPQLEGILKDLNEKTSSKYVTQILPLKEFKLNKEDFLNYYRTRKSAPFCKTYISPKLALLRRDFKEHIALEE